MMGIALNKCLRNPKMNSNCSVDDRRFLNRRSSSEVGGFSVISRRQSEPMSKGLGMIIGAATNRKGVKCLDKGASSPPLT